MMHRSPSAPTGRTALACAVLAVAATGLAGCRTDYDGPQVAGWSMVESTQRHPIIVSQQPQTTQITVPAGARGLNPRQRAELLDFTDRARAADAGNSRIVIQAPGGSANETAAMYAVGEIRSILADNGFSDTAIAVEAYRAGARASAPIRVSYLRYVAEAPQCGYWPTNLAEQRDNGHYPNFGCANQHNLAVMVANPADLIGPRTETARVSERRDVTWDRYVNGKSSASEKSDDERVKIAE